MMALDTLTDLLPELLTTDNGAIVDLRTGEAIDLDDKAAVKAACGAVLDAYALASTKAEALRLEIDERRRAIMAPAIAAAEAALASDGDLRALQIAQAEATATRDSILDGLNGALRGRTGDAAISLDTGAALVTWGKAREVWTLAHPASWYGTPAANRSLRHALAGFCSTADDEDRAIAAVIDWLDPTAKLGDLPPVRVTLRGEK